jgi:DNA modification methylase
MRLKACKEAGLKEVPVIKVNDLTEEQQREFIIKDNVGFGEWDWDLLANDWDADLLDAWGLDIDFSGADDNAGLTDEDDTPEVTENPVSKVGDIWLLGEHRVMCGDSTNGGDVALLMNGEKADMVFTDPPYGISFEDNAGNKIKNDDLNDEKLLEFNKQWQENAFSASAKDCFLLAWQSPRKFHLLDYFGSWRFFRLVTMYKSNRISFPHGAWINKTEPCCIFAKGKPKPTEENYLDDCYVYKHDKESHDDSNVGHPTPKPVKMIIEHITACIKKNQLAFDLFGGSGSTLMACEKTNRNCMMMELDPKYIDVIIKRWQDYTGKKAIHAESGDEFVEVDNGKI